MIKNKIIKYLIITIIVGVIGVWFFVFYFPTTSMYKNIVTKKGGTITAIDLVKLYQLNEIVADSLYNGKQIEVEGTLIKTNVEYSKTFGFLQSNDSLANVYFILKDSVAPLKIGSLLTVKGICNGFLGDVQINDGILVNN